MHQIIGKWVQGEGQSYEGLWFHFQEDGTFSAEYAPMGIVSSGTYTVQNDEITINQTVHNLGLAGEFAGRFAIEENTLRLALASGPGGVRPENLTSARTYEKEI